MHVSVEEADCYLTYDIEADFLTIWLAPIDPRRVVWVGRGSTTAEAMDKYDVDQAQYSPGLNDYLAKWATRNKGDVYLLHANPKLSVFLGSRLNTSALQPAVDGCRVIKDSHEIALIKKANAISTLAHEAVLKNLLSFTSESQVEAQFLETCVAHSAKHQSYDIIAGSGPNAAILHYVKNDEEFGDRQLMCLDAGAEWKGYASDVTRTFPLSGHWPSREAKEIYSLVQRMQEECIATLRPGKHFVETQYLAHCVAIEGLLKLGIFREGYTVTEIYKAGTSAAFFPHGLGHHMGLEVHDVSPPAPSSHCYAAVDDTLACNKIRQYLPDVTTRSHLARMSETLTDPELSRHPCTTSSPTLEAGMVITVEPGM